MESKLGKHLTDLVIPQLLIEPVWNRNASPSHALVAPYQLLIEPVWNRNRACAKRADRIQPLLIEPVWNRNPETLVEWLERVQAELLIEPVWNRNPPVSA